MINFKDMNVTTTIAPADSSDHVVMKSSLEVYQKSNYDYPISPHNYYTTQPSIQYENISPVAVNDICHKQNISIQNVQQIKQDLLHYTDSYNLNDSFNTVNTQIGTPQVTSSTSFNEQTIDISPSTQIYRQCSCCNFVSQTDQELNQHYSTVHFAPNVTSSSTNSTLYYHFSGGTFITKGLKRKHDDLSDVLDLDEQKLYINEDSCEIKVEENFDRSKCFTNLDVLSGSERTNSYNEESEYSPTESYEIQSEIIEGEINNYDNHIQFNILNNNEQSISETREHIMDGQPMFNIEDASLQSNSVVVSNDECYSSEQKKFKTKSKPRKVHHCNVCDKSFSSSGHLKRHFNTRVHLNAHALKIVNSNPENQPVNYPTESTAEDNLNSYGETNKNLSFKTIMTTASYNTPITISEINNSFTPNKLEKDIKKIIITNNNNEFQTMVDSNYDNSYKQELTPYHQKNYSDPNVASSFDSQSDDYFIKCDDNSSESINPLPSFTHLQRKHNETIENDYIIPNNCSVPVVSDNGYIVVHPIKDKDMYHIDKETTINGNALSHNYLIENTSQSIANDDYVFYLADNQDRNKEDYIVKIEAPVSPVDEMAPINVDISPPMTSTEQTNYSYNSNSNANEAASLTTTSYVESSFEGTKESNEAIATSSTSSISECRCLQCGKVFTKSCYLTQHIKAIHSGIKPFRCDRCGKKFYDEGSWNVHLSRHDIKPFKCQQCPKSFNYKTDLRRHMCMHSESKPFTCNYCFKGFVRKDHMVKHYTTHTKKHKAF